MRDDMLWRARAQWRIMAGTTERVNEMHRWIPCFGLVCLGFAIGGAPALAQEEDNDYRALLRKTTTGSICIDYLNAENSGYSGDKMSESLAPDEETRGLSRAIRDECQKHPKESVSQAVSSVKDSYTGKLSQIMERMKHNDDALSKHGGS